MNAAIVKSIYSRGQEWSFETSLDLGVIGEKQVEVFYRHYYENPSADPYQVPEPEYCEVTAVMWGDVDLKDDLKGDLVEDLAFEALDDWRGK